jgi:hypothetical protein
MHQRLVTIILATLIMLPTGLAGAIDFEGEEFRVEWTESTGTVEGYRVLVDRQTEGFVLEQTVTEPTAVLTGTVGQTIVVKVQAFNGQYESEFSEPSDPIRLVTNAPGTIELSCVDPADVLVQKGPNRFACEPAPQPTPAP